MKFKFVYLFLMVGVLFALYPLSLKAQDDSASGGFFGLGEDDSPSDSKETDSDDSQETEKTDLDKSTAQKMSDKDIEKLKKTFVEKKPIDLDRIIVRVNDSMLTQRELSIAFALKQLSSIFSKMQTKEQIKEQIVLLLGLKTYINENSLYNLLPARNDIKKRLDFIVKSLNVDDVQGAVEKIDPNGALTVKDLKKFFYYDTLNQKGFSYFYQREFKNKIFLPREDEINFTYRQFKSQASYQSILKKPSTIFILNMVVKTPKSVQIKDNLIDKLTDEKRKILKERDFKKRKAMFIRLINKYGSPQFQTKKVIGPLDEKIVNDFPEYQNLFTLNKGGVSQIIDQDHLLRLVFIMDKKEGAKKSLKDADVKARISSYVYSDKSQFLFDNFLHQNIKKLDVEYYKVG